MRSNDSMMARRVRVITSTSVNVLASDGVASSGVPACEAAAPSNAGKWRHTLLATASIGHTLCAPKSHRCAPPRASARSRCCACFFVGGARWWSRWGAHWLGAAWQRRKLATWRGCVPAVRASGVQLCAASKNSAATCSIAAASALDAPPANQGNGAQADLNSARRKLLSMWRSGCMPSARACGAWRCTSCWLAGGGHHIARSQMSALLRLPIRPSVGHVCTLSTSRAHHMCPVT